MMENKIIDTNIHFEKWTEWIKEYPKLEEIWNSIPEPLYTLLKIQIDNYALSALQALETDLTEKHRAEVEGLKRYVYHTSDCGIEQRDELKAMRKVAERYRNDTYYRDLADMESSPLVCTCGLEQLLTTNPKEERK
jgi:hypothetical protein